MKRQAILLSLLLLPVLSACSTEGFTRGAYESLRRKQCVDTTGSPNCDLERRNYNRTRQDHEPLNRPPP